MSKSGLVEKYKNIEIVAEQNKEIILTNIDTSFFEEIKNFGVNFEEKISDLKRRENILRIGIVGQVNAGKSSFLNSLFFEGKSILPKASTPMTAALTILEYSEKNYAEIEFYTKDDWEVVRKKAKEFKELFDKKKNDYHKDNIYLPDEKIKEEVQLSLGEEAVALNMLHKQAESLSIDIDKYLGRKETILDIKSKDDLMNRLKDYVGSGGKFTPFTRNIKIFLNISELQGIQVVDTPGVNDPIISRGRITEKFLAQCDCVFLLSYSGQFMGSEDAQFLVSKLPNQGITKIVLLGSKFDSVLIDESKKYKGDFLETVKNVSSKLSNQATSAIDSLLDGVYDSSLSSKLKDCLPPKYISAICFSLAVKESDNLDETENHSLINLKKRFKNFDFNKENLLDLSNINNIKEKDLEALKNDKKRILENKITDIAKGHERAFSEICKNFLNKIEDGFFELKNNDLEKLEKDFNSLNNSINSAQSQINYYFQDMARGVKWIVSDQIIPELQKIGSTFKNLEVYEKQEVSHSERYGFLWLKKRNIYKTVSYARVYDAADSVGQCVESINSFIRKKWSRLFDFEKVERDLGAIILNYVDVSSESFNPNNIINSVKNTLADFLVEPYNADSDKYEQIIAKNFSDSVVSGDSETLRLKEILRKTVKEIEGDIKENINFQKDNLIQTIENNSNNFLDNIIKNSKELAEQKKEEIKNKKEIIPKYENLINSLKSIVL
ncbi:MAG: dynamin family protein [Desulforegulaceae bacterium]|nr:dynamin family protein [Desulforegulaceae bacterium]